MKLEQVCMLLIRPLLLGKSQQVYFDVFAAHVVKAKPSLVCPFYFGRWE